jgi:hypothetical protein
MIWTVSVLLAIQGSCGFEVNLFENIDLPIAYAKRELVSSLVKGFEYCPFEKNVFSRIKGEIVVFEAFFMNRPSNLRFKAVNSMLIDSLFVKNETGFSTKNIISISVDSPSKIDSFFSRIEYIEGLTNGAIPSVFALGIPASCNQNVNAKDYLGRLNCKSIGNTLIVKPRFPISKGTKYAFKIILECQENLNYRDLLFYYPVKAKSFYKESN